jgi:hypothetical protein
VVASWWVSSSDRVAATTWRSAGPSLRFCESVVFDGRVDRPWGTAFAVWLVGVATFQTALAIGAPWGAAAWGGAHRGVLPGRLRAVSTAGAIAWFGAATVAAGTKGSESVRRRVLRGATGFAGLSVLLNGASRSRVERAIWVPVTSIGAALGVLALRETTRR